MSLLQLRLKNCIQTILELKPCLLNENIFFESDFIFLKNYLDRIEKMDLLEDEVIALEGYTCQFLSEIGTVPNWNKIYKNLQ